MASCGLNDTKWDTHLPPFFGLLLEEGRKSSAKVKNILAALTKPQGFSFDAVTITVTDELTKDMQELKFI